MPPDAARRPRRHTQRLPRGGGQLARRLVATARLLGHALGDDLVERGELGIDGRRLRHRRTDVARDLLLEAVHRVGPRARQAFVQHARQRIHVRAYIDVPALEPLGGHVRHGSERASGRGQPGVAGRAGQAEVDQVGEVTVGDQDVGRFDVPVDQARFVRGIQRGRDLVDNRYGQRRIQRLAAIAEDRPEVLALDQPHVQVEAVLDLAETVDRHHMRFVDARRGLRLPPEPLLEGDVLGQMRGQHLQRDDAVGLGVVGQVDLAHSAAADQLLQLIVPEWCRIHRVYSSGAGPPADVSIEATSGLPKMSARASIRARCGQNAAMPASRGC